MIFPKERWRMALSDTLKALGQIVLGQIDLSPDFAERKKQVSSQFPGLTTIEIEDLCKIKPDRFALYTGTIINGEANVLGRHFPLTFALLEKYFEKIRNLQLNRYNFVKQMLGKYPWKETGTFSLCESLLCFIKEDLKDICEACPYLVPIIELETSTMKCFREKDDSTPKNKILKIANLTTLTVGEIEELEFFVPYNIEFNSCAYDIVDFREQFFKNESSLPISEPKFKDSFFIASRGTDFAVRWNSINSELFSYLKSKPRSELFSVSELAECFITSQPDQKDPAVIFSLFFEQLATLIKRAVIVVTAR
jgi:hypothetical protein